MTKILIIDNSTYVTGAIKSIVGVANALRADYDFEFAMAGKSAAADFVRTRGFFVHDVSFVELGRSIRALFYPFALVRSSLKIAKVACTSKVNIVHVNDIYNLSGLVAARMVSGVRVVQHVRLLRSSYLRPVYGFLSRLVCGCADAVVAVSRSVWADLGRHKNIRIIYNAIDGAPKHERKSYREYSLDCRFLYVGNYVSGKGHDLAIKAFSLIAGELPGATLTLVGSGAGGELDLGFVSHLRELIAKTRLSERVLINGRVDDVEAAMKQADIILNFSSSESFSRVCLEAMAYGVPLISTDSGGPGELIEHGVTGFLVPCGSVRKASRAMLWLATDVALATRMGREAAARVPVRFSIDIAAEQIASVYAEVLER